MRYRQHTSAIAGRWALTFLLLAIIPGVIFAQTVFSFNVDNLESYTRTGNWVWDIDNAGVPFPPIADGSALTWNGTSQHFYADMNVGPMATPGHVTNITCAVENTDVAATPAEVSLVFTQPFQLVHFERINTVNEALPWNTPGQAGDRRIYGNATGYLALNGTPKLYVKNLTFVITTPYPSQAQIRSLSPVFAGWLGSIGTGAPQTGYGYGDVDTAMSEVNWAALFAASGYKIDMPMLGIASEMSIAKSWFDFTLNFDLGDPARGSGSGQSFSLPVPANLSFPDQNVLVDLSGGTNPYAGLSTHYFYVNEIPLVPGGALPGGLNSQAKKYWKIGTTLDTFVADISFTLNQSDFASAKGIADWVVLHKPDGGAWSIYPAMAISLPNTIKALGVTEANLNDEFTVASSFDETLPITLSSFTATVNSQNMLTLAWSTASETSMQGYNVYYKPAISNPEMICLTPVLIPAENSSSGSHYSFVADDLTEPGTYYFWLEAISIDGSSEFFGPVNATLSATEVPPLPDRTQMSEAWPNPFRIGQQTNIEVQMKAGESGSVSIYNLLGQVVKSYSVKSGTQILNWDGLDKRGNFCASGVYFYKLQSPSISQTKKMVIIR